MKKIFYIIMAMVFSYSIGSAQTVSELIGNNGFESGLDGWAFNVDTTNGCRAVFELDTSSVITDSNSVKCTIYSSPGGGPSSRIALYVGNISMEEGKDYNISFKLKSTKAYPEKWDIPYWTVYKDSSLSAYYDYGTVLVAKADSIIEYKETYSATFTNTTIFSIDLGYFPVSDTVTFWIDDVSIIDLNAPKGSGTKADPYQVASSENLLWISQHDTVWGAYFLQTADIDAAATETDGWSTIGNTSKSFTGSYDGDGYKIDNLHCGTDESDYVALFGVTEDGKIQNVNLTNVSIKGNSYVAALVAQSSNDTIVNCSSSGNIELGDSEKTDPAEDVHGGLIGKLSNGNVSECNSSVNISGLHQRSLSGGLIGAAYDSSVITNSYAEGNISGKDKIGGFIGYVNNSDVSCCYATGLSDCSKGYGAGGFVGVNDTNGKISECYSTGDAKGYGAAAGFAGENYGTISNCYAMGDVLACEDVPGGFVGKGRKGLIEYCYSIGKVIPDTTRGFIGKEYNDGGLYVSNYFDSTASGTSNLYPQTATGKTTAEMKTESTFTDWDFTSIWKVEGNYPNLINNVNPNIKPEGEIQDPLPDGEELIVNHGFNDGLYGWSFNNTDTLAHATYELDKNYVINGPNSVKVHMDTCKGGTPSGRIALYTPVPIEEGHEYYITFKIKANESVPLWNLYWVFYSSIENGVYYDPVGGWGVTTWSMEKDSVYKFELNYTPDFTNPETYFSIDFGYFATGPVDFWVDDIHIIKIEKSKSKSLAFNLSDTRNQYVIAEDTLNFGLDSTWTMEGWFKFANFDAPGGENHLMRLGGQLFVDSEKHLKVKTDDYVAGTTELEKDKWYHIAYVRTPENVTVYLDGVKEIVAAGADAGAEADRFLIGAYNTTSTDYNFAGVLDEIRLWSVARTEAEINATKEVELSGTEDSLVIYYNFNEQRGNTVIDEAGGDNNGELVNMDDTNWSEDNPFDRPMPPDELPLPDGRDLISNNYFNDGLTGWDLNLAVQSSATLALDNSGALESEKSAKVHVNTVFNDDDWKIQFRQLELDTAIIAGHSYHIQYRIKASKDVSGINSVIQKNHGDFGNVYSKEISLLADSAISVVDTFICTETDDQVELAFNLGTISVADIDIWFDAIHLIDLGELSDVEEQRVIPAVFSLSQNYPNPFNPTTTINFSIPVAGKATLIVYNVLGQKVATLVDSELPAGIYKYKFDASRFASGVYFYQLRSKNFNKIKKMMLIK